MLVALFYFARLLCLPRTTYAVLLRLSEFLVFAGIGFESAFGLRIFTVGRAESYHIYFAINLCLYSSTVFFMLASIEFVRTIAPVVSGPPRRVTFIARLFAILFGCCYIATGAVNYFPLSARTQIYFATNAAAALILLFDFCVQLYLVLIVLRRVRSTTKLQRGRSLAVLLFSAVLLVADVSTSFVPIKVYVNMDWVVSLIQCLFQSCSVQAMLFARSTLVESGICDVTPPPEPNRARLSLFNWRSMQSSSSSEISTKTISTAPSAPEQLASGANPTPTDIAVALNDAFAGAGAASSPVPSHQQQHQQQPDAAERGLADGHQQQAAPVPLAAPRHPDKYAAAVQPLLHDHGGAAGHHDLSSGADTAASGSAAGSLAHSSKQGTSMAGSSQSTAAGREHAAARADEATPTDLKTDRDGAEQGPVLSSAWSASADLDAGHGVESGVASSLEWTRQSRRSVRSSLNSADSRTLRAFIRGLGFRVTAAPPPSEAGRSDGSPIGSSVLVNNV
nr:hypothetical protein HK105_007306 [Polyrhizophydium stewartii]